MGTNYSLDNLVTDIENAAFSTGVPELDQLFSKGFPKGKLHKFYGYNNPGGLRTSIYTLMRIAKENFLRSPFAKLNLVRAQFWDISDQVLEIVRDNLQSPRKSLFPVTSKTIEVMKIGV